MAAPVNVYALWDNVIISVYNGAGGFPIYGGKPDQSQGTVEAIGPNVDRVSVGQLVVFNNTAIITDTTGNWQVVPQSAILVTYKYDILP